MSRSKPHGGLILHVSPVAEGSAQSTGGCGKEEPPMPRSTKCLAAGVFSFPLWLPGISGWKAPGVCVTENHDSDPHDGTRRAIPPALCGVLSPAPRYTAQLSSFTAACLHSLPVFSFVIFTSLGDTTHNIEHYSITYYCTLIPTFVLGLDLQLSMLKLNC